MGDTGFHEDNLRGSISLPPITFILADETGTLLCGARLHAKTGSSGAVVEIGALVVAENTERTR